MITLRDVLIFLGHQNEKEYDAYSNLLYAATHSIKLLDRAFSSLHEGFLWLSDFEDQYLLRKEFKNEGTGKDKEISGINTLRWNVQNEIKIEEIEKTDHNSLNYKLYQSAKELGFIQSSPWPHHIKIKSVVLICSMERFAKERIDFISHFKGDVYALSGARGLFNNEPSLAFILAIWFKKYDKVNLIQEVLAEHSDPNDPLQWTLNLTGLKRKLSTKLGETNWPSAPDSYYYRHKKLYDAAAKASGREMLDCDGGPWPVTMDMVAYHCNPLKSINLIPVIAIGKDNKLATMDDTIRTWYLQYGREIISKGEKPLFVMCNNMHILPFAKIAIQNNTNCQHEIIQYQMLNQLAAFGKSTDSKNEFDKILVAGPAAKIFNLKNIFDAMAKSLYPLRRHINKLVKEYFLYLEKEPNPQALYAKKMIIYHSHDYLLLANAAINLSYTYYLIHDFIKTSGLLNFGINVLKKRNKRKLYPLIDAIYHCTIVNMHDFIVFANHRLYQHTNSIDQNYLKKLDIENRLKLSNVRQRIYSQLLRNEQIDKIYNDCFNQLKHYYISIINQAMIFFDENQAKIAFAYMGSNSRKQATPFSDVESFVIVENHNNIDFTKEVTKLILLQIINLGETVLSSLGIQIFDKNKREINLRKIYDSYTRDGYSFDQNISQACKTPLGKKANGKVIFRLIGTPGSLAALASTEGFNIDPYLPQLLRLSKFITGNHNLYRDFKNSLNHSQFNLTAYSQYLIAKDNHKYWLYLNEATRITHISHKKYYRFLICLIDNLFISVCNHQNASLQFKLMYLNKQNLLSENEEHRVRSCSDFIKEMRLTNHFLFNEQKIELSTKNVSAAHFIRSQSIIHTFFNDRINKRITDHLIDENELSLSFNK